MSRLRRGLTVTVLIALAVSIFGATWISSSYPAVMSNLMLGIYYRLPGVLRNSTATWSVMRSLLWLQYHGKEPTDVRKEREGFFNQPADYLVVSLGDSTTAGTGVGSLEAWPFLWQEMLRHRVRGKVRVINAGLNGETSVDGRDRLARDALALHPNLVTIGYLINDTRLFDVDRQSRPRVMVPHDEYVASFAAMVDQLRAADVPVMIFTCHPIREDFFYDKPDVWAPVQDALFARRVGLLLGMAAPPRVTVVDTFAAVTGSPEAEDLYQLDGFHLNARGHKLVADMMFQAWMANIHPTLPPALRR